MPLQNCAGSVMARPMVLAALLASGPLARLRAAGRDRPGQTQAVSVFPDRPCLGQVLRCKERRAGQVMSSLPRHLCPRVSSICASTLGQAILPPFDQGSGFFIWPRWSSQTC